MTTTHPFAPEEMMAICDGELPAAEAQELAAHLESCAECAEQVKQMRQVSQTMAGWSAPQLSRAAEQNLREGLRRAAYGGKIGKGASRPGRGRRSWVWMKLGGVGAAAAALLLLAAGVSVWRGFEPAGSPQGARVMSYLEPANPEPAPGGAGIAGIAAPGYVAQQQAIEERKAYADMSENLENQPRGGGGGAPLPDSPPVAQGPLIARTASLSIVVKNVGTARKSLDDLLAREHGYAEQITVATPDNDAPSLQASLRIPAANLPAAMADLRALGRVANESESGEDVTQQHVDLDQRLKTARETEDRFRAILAQRTGSVSDVLQVEEQIASVRGEIESMEAEQTNLEHRVSFATIDLTLSEASSATIGGSSSLSARVHDAFVGGFRHAAETVIAIFLFVVEYGLTILIWIAILAVPVILLRRRYRRIRAKI